ILLNPNNDQCPDYSLPEHARVLAVMVNPNTTPVQAAQLLQNLWNIRNTDEKVAWRQQIDTDLANRDTDEAAIAEEARLERDTQYKDERKRNKEKYTPIPLDRAIPQQPRTILSAYATRKLDKGQYLQLWYVTNDGIETARHSVISAEASSMVVVSNDDGTTAWQAAAQPARGVIADEDLPWEVLCNACPRFIKAI
ncbi:hypothetical protein FIBSPDRAFT_656562, partial [Athelia psychrophila]